MTAIVESPAADGRRRRLRRVLTRRRLGLAVLSFAAGVVGMLAFPTYGWWPLAFVSVAALNLLSRGRTWRGGVLVATCYGAGLFGPMLKWTGVYVGSVPWLILTFSQMWYLMAMGAVLPLVLRSRFAVLGSASLWVADEAVRGRWPFGGFPWGRWAFSQSTSPLRWFAALGGSAMVTFAVVVVGALLAQAVVGGVRVRIRLASVVGLALVVALGAVLRLPVQVDSGRRITVAAIQGDVPDRGLEFNARREQVLRNHVDQTLKLAAEIKAGTVAKPEFVAWPEDSSDIDPFDNADAAKLIQQAVDAVGVPILIGTLLDGPGPDHVTNAGFVWSPSDSAKPGAGEEYVKRHPVPFGEYIPLRSIARMVSKDVDLVPRDMIAGKGNGRLTIAGVPVGDVICFEIAYDGLVRSSVSAGAQMLIVQTNNATFGHTAETYQQLAMSRLRAVEYGRSVVQAATSGKSAIIAPDGSIQQQSGALYTPAVLDQTIVLSSVHTPALDVEAWLEWVLAVLFLLPLVGSKIHRRRAAFDRTRTMETEGPTGDQVAEPRFTAGTTGR